MSSREFIRTKSRFLHNHWGLVIGGVLILISLGVFWLDGVRTPFVSSDFSYSADLVSRTNQYDAGSSRYLGERYTRSNFFLQPQSNHDGITTVRNVVETSEFGGGHPNRVTKMYEVTSKTGAYITQTGAETEYLFAPRNLKKDQTFGYRHILYSSPARMYFAGEETINNLKVYRYNADFSRAGVLPANNLAARPSDLSAGRGLEYVPHLQLWIEPETGWLVKSAEDTTVYYYDTATGQRLEPYLHFADTFTETSIAQQATYARDLKARLSFARQVVPAVFAVIFLLATIIMLMRAFRIRSFPVQMTLGIVLAISLASTIGWLLRIDPLMTLFTGGVAVNPMVNVCFVFLAVSMFWTYRGIFRASALLLISFVAVVSALQMLSSIGLIPFDADLILFREIVLEADKSIPSRFPLVASMLFFILSIGLLKALLTKTSATIRFARLAASIVTLIGLTGMLIKLLLLDRVLDITFVLPLPLAVTFLFVVSGYAMFQILQHRHGHTTDAKSVFISLARQSIIALPILIIGIAAQIQQNSMLQQLRAAFSAQITTIETSIETGANVYTNVLTGAKSLFAASTSVERNEWDRYTQAFDVKRHYPGVQNIGFITSLKPDEVASVIQRARAEGLPSFDIFPKENRPAYTTVLYISPLNAANSKELGYDMSNDDTRRRAMERAQIDNRPTISDKVSLLRDDGRAPRTGFLLFVPVYKKGQDIDTLPQRLQALDGYVYSSFDAPQFLSGIIGDAAKHLDVAIYDGFEVSNSALLYTNNPSNYDTNTRNPSAIASSRTVYVGNHPWTVHYVARPTFHLSSAQERLPSVTLVVGSSMYFLVVLVLYSARALRRRAVTFIQDSDRVQKHDKHL